MDRFLEFIQRISRNPTIEHPFSIHKRVEEYKNFFDTLKGILEDAGYKYDYISLIESIYYYWAVRQYKPWLQDKYVIALIGKFSSGKSSIVNSILGSNILPVDVTPTTSIPTYISFDTKGTDCLVVDKDDNIKKINFDDVKILSKDNIGDFPVSMLFKYLVITNNNRNLLHKTILDTPGYNSTDEVDMAATSSVISDSDAVFWIIDINDGTISADSIRFIKETIQQKPLYIIINKVDMKSPRDREMIKENVIRMLKKESINFIDCLLYSSRSNEYRDKISSLISGLVRDTQKGFKQILFEVIDGATNNISDQLKDLINKKRDIEKRRESIESDYKNNIHQINSKLTNYL